LVLAFDRGWLLVRVELAFIAFIGSTLAGEQAEQAEAEGGRGNHGPRFPEPWRN